MMQPNKKQHPTRPARERGSPDLPARRSGRPSLSASYMTQFFLVKDFVENEIGVEEEYTWRPHEVRFVLWYHVTTHLSYEAIAIAFNATFGSDNGGVPEIAGTNVQTIIDVIRSRSGLIDSEMAERELEPWPRPDEIGWIPCDHGMGCATLSKASQGRVASVMRGADLRTRWAREIAEMGTGLWEGSWDQLLQCPRRHEKDVPATTTPTYSPPTIGAYQRTPRPGERKRKPVEVITISDSGDSTVTDVPKTSNLSASVAPSAGLRMGQIGPNISLSPVRGLRSSPRKAGVNLPPTRAGTSVSSSMKPSNSSSTKENRSPAKNFRSASQPQAIDAVEEESDIEWDEPTLSQPIRAITRSSGGAVSSGPSSYQTATACSTRTRSSANSSSYASARSRVSAEDVVSPLSRPITAPTNTVVNPAEVDVKTIRSPRGGVIRAVFDLFGGSDAFWFVLQQTIRGICFCLLLDPYLEFLDENFDNFPQYLWERNWWPLLQFICVLLVGREVMTYAFKRARNHVWRRWGADISLPEASHLSPAAYFLFLSVAWGLTMLVYPRWAKHTQSLLQKLLLRYAAQEVTSLEVLGSDETT